MPAENVNPLLSPKTLRVLFVEDSPRDVKLMARMLEQAGYQLEFETVDTPGLFRGQLEKACPQIIICDHNLRGWTAMDVLEALKQMGKDVPVIVVTGSLGDEAAVECLKRGAADFVLKDRPARLPMAVERALIEKSLGGEHKRVGAENARLVTAIEQSADGVLITDVSGVIQYANPALFRITGYSREEVLGRNPRFLKSSQQDPAFYRQLWETILRGEVWHGELINRRKDGSLYPEEMTIAPIRNAQGEVTHFIATKQDVTLRKGLEQQLRQAQKMEAVGRLAGGIAHDFNNFLTIIAGYCDLLLSRLPAEDTLHGSVIEIKKAGERATSLTRQLLAFSRQQVMAPQVLDLNEVVASMDKMLRRVIGEDVELKTVYAKDLGRVKADPGQVEQVILNLAVNARDAMPEGGKLTVETANMELDEAYARSHVAVKPGPYVMLAVSDTGCGMDEEVQSHLFEPFFTTKELGKGTGLGLSTMYGIVKQSGGNIWVYSEPGRGTTFKVYLPRVEELAEPVKPVEARTGALRGSETVLLVEDEAPVRALVRGVLESRGYKVLEAHHGADALKVSERHGGPIHLLLTDVVMPRMSGKELAGRVAPQRPEMKVLYMSGYTDNTTVRHGVLEPGSYFLQKPFTPEALARKVREVLEG